MTVFFLTHFFIFSLIEIANTCKLHKSRKRFPTKASDGHSYVNSVASNGGGNCAQHAQSSGSSGQRRSDQRDYVNQPVSGSGSGGHHHHHHHHHPGNTGRDNAAHQKHRRTQKRVTHNEKRYHSGNDIVARRRGLGRLCDVICMCETFMNFNINTFFNTSYNIRLDLAQLVYYELISRGA